MQGLGVGDLGEEEPTKEWEEQRRRGDCEKKGLLRRENGGLVNAPW